MDLSLYRAAIGGNVYIIRQHRMNLEDQLTPNNNTVLHVAVMFGNTACAKEVIRYSPSLSCRVNIQGDTPLHIAARNGCSDIVVALVKCTREMHGAGKEMLRMQNKENDTPLHEAVRNGRFDVVKLLVKEDPDFSYPTNNAEETPLYLASEKGYDELVSLILETCTEPAYCGSMASLLRWKPSLVKETDLHGWTPLHFAARFGYASIVSQLLKADKSLGYIADNDAKNTALHIAASRGHIDVMGEFFEHCPDCCEMVNARGRNFLHIAAEHDQGEAVTYILEKCAIVISFINQKDIDGNTPLHLFATSNCLPQLGLISHPGADTNAFNKKNLTPMDRHPSKYLFSFQIFNYSKPSNTCNVNFTMDPSNSYFIHHSDHPSHLLVPIKLNGANYSSWSKSMIHALTAKNKIGFINGSIEQPSEKDQPTEYALWNQCNSMILSWLTHSVEPDLAKGVIHAKTAYQVWEDFKDHFSQNNAPAIYQIQKSLASFSQGTMPVSTYFTKLKGLWDELDIYRALPTCNQMKAHDEQREEDRLMQFLMGLHDTYNVVRTNILMMSPLPNVRQAYSLVIQEETQRQMTPESTENFSIAAAIQRRGNHFSNKSKDKHCEHCNREGHTIESCRTLKFHCKYCDRKGHTEDRCKFKNGTWVSNNTGGQGNRHNTSQQRQHGFQGNAFHVANTTDSSQSTHGVHSQDTNSSPGLSTYQLQQLAHALSMMTQNQKSPGNSDAYANAAGLGYGEDDWLG
ncbi:hypothetical protein RJ640_021987 [Escallonia rubra]|uniref:Ankyrin repeat-containing protein n=1 Tax=Escallonia rubra TaxID=112253 RepID=A0AA88U272_9ASTE|nr:hypothetical protein RJ640_021987 [Escallonia rubra]